MIKYFFILIISLFSVSAFSQVEITSVEVQEHINFLASEELKGRYPGTAEDSIAAEYIRTEFKNLGLELLFDNGFQYFNIEKTPKVSGTKKLSIDNFSCKYVEEYVPLYFSASGKNSGKAIFVGYGMNIETDDYTWNDYENADVKGKWAIILRGSPELDTYPDDYFDRYSTEYSKTVLATDMGAIGVIFVNGTKAFPNDDLIEPCNSRFSEKAQIPAYSVKRFTGDRLLKQAKTSVAEVEKTIHETGKSFSLNLNVVISNELTMKPTIETTHNIVAYLEGNDEKLKHEIIVIGAHYDHLGMGGCGSGSKMPDTIAVHYGADDNASGVAGVLEIAEYVAANQQKIG